MKGGMVGEQNYMIDKHFLNMSAHEAAKVKTGVWKRGTGNDGKSRDPPKRGVTELEPSTPINTSALLNAWKLRERNFTYMINISHYEFQVWHTFVACISNKWSGNLY